MQHCPYWLGCPQMPLSPWSRFCIPMQSNWSLPFFSQQIIKWARMLLTWTCSLQCPTTRDESRPHFIDSVIATLSKLMAHPILKTLLLEAFTLYFTCGNQLDLKEDPPEFQHLVLQKNKIGWDQLFSSWLSKLWACHQHLFYKQYKLIKRPTTVICGWYLPQRKPGWCGIRFGKHKME